MGADFNILGENGNCLTIAENEGHFKLIEYLREWESNHKPISNKLILPPPSQSMKIII